MQLHFCEYEPWMKDQVIEMFCEEYGNSREQFSAYYDEFYNTYQQNKAIRLVILEEKVVAGFVSFSFWPYSVDGKLTNSYQCGNVIINKNYRGKGLYNKLLNYFNDNASKYNIDFIIGFPIKPILKLYIKSGWKNPFNLNWYVKIVNPLGKLFKINNEKLKAVFHEERKHSVTLSEDSNIILHIDQDFFKWNKAYNNLSKHYYFEYTESHESIEFSLKINHRKYLNELIIGDVNTNSLNPDFINRAFKKLIKRSRKLPGVSILSICLNSQNSTNKVFNATLHNGFRKIDRDIKFIINNFRMDESQLLKPENWVLYRRDVDTW